MTQSAMKEPKELRAKLVSLRSIELDIRIEYPSDPENFVLSLEAEIGADGVEGAEVFRIDVCTPQWLAAQATREGPIWGHALLIVEQWDYERVLLSVRALCERTVAHDWAGMANRLARFTQWEFQE